MARLAQSEPGYSLQRLPAVLAGGEAEVEVFVMQDPQPAALSERYAGKARARLSRLSEREASRARIGIAPQGSRASRSRFFGVLRAA